MLSSPAPRTFRKAELANNAAGCTGATMAVYRPATTTGDLSTSTIQPVHHVTYPSSLTGATNPGYAVSARIGSETSYSAYRVRNTAGGAGPPQLQRTSFNGQSLYFAAPSAPQLAGGDTVSNTGTTQIHQATGLANSLWLAHTTVCQAGGGANESCFRVVNFNVAQSTGGAPVATLGEHKTVSGGADVFYMYPAIAVNRDGRVVVPFLRSSAST